MYQTVKSMQQWLRECYVRVGKINGIEINGLRIVFDVKLSIESDPNTAEIQIYNLNQQSRDLITKEFERIELYAGYGTAELIYSGDIRTVNTHRDGADLITTVFSGDGDEALKKSTVNTTLPAGRNTAKAAVLEIAKTFKLPIGDIAGLDDLPGYNRDLVLSGSSKSRLDMLAKRYDFQWSIRSGAFEATKRDATIGDVYSINPDSGLVGIPEVKEEAYIAFTCLLNPHIMPSRIVEVTAVTATLTSYESKPQSSGKREDGKPSAASQVSADSMGRNAKFEGGAFKVEEMSFTGDNLRGDFHCHVEKARRIINGKAVISRFEKERAIKLTVKASAAAKKKAKKNAKKKDK